MHLLVKPDRSINMKLIKLALWKDSQLVVSPGQNCSTACMHMGVQVSSARVLCVHVRWRLEAYMLLQVCGAFLVQYGPKINQIQDLFSGSTDHHGGSMAEIPACLQDGLRSHFPMNSRVFIFGIRIDILKCRGILQGEARKGSITAKQNAISILFRFICNWTMPICPAWCLLQCPDTSVTANHLQ